MAVTPGLPLRFQATKPTISVQQILEFGEVRRGLLGIKGGELNADLAKAFKCECTTRCICE